MKRIHRPYELQEYDPKWKESFSSIEKRIRPIFGDNLISIEHIGSTSIEGMLAKPQIDVLVVAKDLDLIPTIYDSFKKSGFTPRGKEYVGNGDEYVTEDGPDGKRLASIHILQDGHPQINEYRALREYLRKNKTERELYASTKRRLYSEHKDDFDSYDQGKHEVISLLIERALTWYGQNSSK